MKQIVLIIFILFIAAAAYVLTLPPKKITLKDIHPPVTHSESPKETEAGKPAPFKGREKDGTDTVKAEYYIIVESCTNLNLAQQKKEKLTNDFNINFILLPATPEGYYRISYGKFSSMEEAKLKIKGVRTKICSDAWIYSEKTGFNQTRW
jgi:hypothetical protein